MACWFKPNNLTVNNNLMFISQSTFSSYAGLIFDGANANGLGDNVLLAEVVGTGGQADAVSATGGTAGVWMHCAGVFTSNTARKAFLNGVGGTSNTTSVSLNSISVTAIGSLSTFSPIDGALAEVAMWGAALTDAEILMLSKGVSPQMVRPQKLAKYWPLWGRGTEFDLVGRQPLTLVGTMAQAEHAPQFYPARSVIIGLGTTGGGTQGITGALVTDADTFFASTVSATYAITGALYTDADTFYGSTVTAGSVNISGALYSDADTFYGATVAAGSVNIGGALFSDADTFFGATVAAGSVNIGGALFTDADTFYAATVSGAGSPQTITGALYSDTDTFFGATIAAGAVGITGSLYSDPDTFYAATVGQAADQAISGALYANDNTFFGATISGGLQPSIPNTGGSGNASHGAGRGRNINDDPDAFSELLKEWRARKERPHETSVQEIRVLGHREDVGADHPQEVDALADDLREHLSRLEAAFDRSMVAYEAALAKMERARAVKAQRAAIAQEEQARQQAMQLAIEWELARIAYEDFLEEEDEIMLLTAA